MKIKCTTLLLVFIFLQEGWCQSVPFNFKGATNRVTIDNSLRKELREQKLGEFKKLIYYAKQKSGSIDSIDFVFNYSGTDIDKAISVLIDDDLLKSQDINENRIQYEFYKEISQRYELLTREERRKILSELPSVGKLNLNDIIKQISEDAARSVRVSSIESNNDATIRSLKVIARKYHYLDRTNKVFNSIFHGGGFLRNSTDAQLYYDERINGTREKFLKNTLFSINSDGSTASIYNDLYTDYFGPVRLNFGMLVSSDNKDDAPDDESINDATQRLLGGGGNVVIGTNFPFMDIRTRANDFRFSMQLSPKIGLDIPALNKSIDGNDVALNTDLCGLQATSYWTGFNQMFTFYGNFRYSRMIGSDNFFGNLGLENENGFNHTQATIGVALNSAFRISYTWNWISGIENGDSLELPSMLGFSIVPN